jgi:proline iminopeptidase
LELSASELVIDNITSRASKAEKIFMKQVEDSIANHTASKELLRAYSKTFIRFFLYDATKVDSLSAKIKGTINNVTHDLILQDLARINFNLKPWISKLKTPILTICGRQDPVGVFPTFTIQESNKRAKIYWVEKSGHFPWLEQPESFYSELLNFLK